MNGNILSVCFILFIHSGLFAQCANPANIYSFSYGGKTYELVKEKKSWTDAAACAVSKGGYLVQIDDANEQTAMVNALTASGISTTYNPIADGGGTSYIWLGATDKVTEGTWIWDGNNDGSGTNFWNGEGSAGQNNGAIVSGMYVNWGGKAAGTINEPDNFNGVQDGAALALTGWPAGGSTFGAAGEWNDINITNTNYYIIEYGTSTGYTQPSAVPVFGVYPNPARSAITITTTEEIQSVKILNAQGVMVYEFSEKLPASCEIPVVRFSSGIYLVVAEFNTGEIRSLRFIKE